MNKFKLRKYKSIFPLCVTSRKSVQYFSRLNLGNSSEVNEIGYRGISPLNIDTLDVAAFGCSFTFGVGVKEPETYISKFAKNNNLSNYANFGMPGESIRHIADLYVTCCRLWNIKKSVILLPSIYRSKLYGILDSTYHISTSANAKYHSKIEKRQLKTFRDEEYAQIAIESLERIILSSEKYKIDYTIASYMQDTHNVLEVLEVDYKKFAVIDKGNDGSHPGPLSHEKFASII